jgi:hypothetical protein
MSNWHGLVYPLKPGSESAVEAAFQTTDHPKLEVNDEAGNPVGKLLGTLAFIGKEVAVRIIEIEGSPREVSAHMGRQPQARVFQGQLQPHLSVARDLGSLDSMRAFFMHATLECVLDRRDGQSGFQPESNWHGLMYPLKPGSESDVRALLQDSPTPDLTVTDAAGASVGRVLGTVAFVGQEKAVRLTEVDGPADQVGANMAGQPAAREFQRRLQPYLAVPRDLNSPEAMREFFQNATLRCVLSRHNGGNV